VIRDEGLAHGYSDSWVAMSRYPRVDATIPGSPTTGLSSLGWEHQGVGDLPPLLIGHTYPGIALALEEVDGLGEVGGANVFRQRGVLALEG
jgi:hypothetical protein